MTITSSDLTRRKRALVSPASRPRSTGPCARSGTRPHGPTGTGCASLPAIFKPRRGKSDPLFQRQRPPRAASPVMELVRLAVDIAVTGAKAAIAFAFFLWIAGRFGLTGLQSLLGKAGI